MKKDKKIGKVIKYIVVLIIAIAVVLVVRFFASKKQIEYVPPVPAVDVVIPVKGTIDESLILSAHIEARDMVPVIPMVSGTIMYYPIVAGDVVSKGDVLTQIDKGPFQQQMLQARAAYKGYASSFTRVEGLYKAGAATKQDYDTLKSQRDAAKAQYDLASLQLGYATVTSPVNGTVIAAPMAAGSAAGAPNPVAVIANLDDLVIRLNVPEKYYPVFVRNKDNLTATVIRPDYENIGGENTCKAVVDTIAPYIDGASKTFEAVFKLEDVPIDFKPGMYVQIKVKFNDYEDVCLIPRSAKLNDGTIYILNESEKETENESSGDNLEVVDLEKLNSEKNVISGTVESIKLDEYVTDSEWLMVPEKYKEKLFVIRGQNNILSGQSVNAKKETVVWPSVKGEE